jgi:hypothetical protein
MNGCVEIKVFAAVGPWVAVPRGLLMYQRFTGTFRLSFQDVKHWYITRDCMKWEKDIKFWSAYMKETTWKLYMDDNIKMHLMEIAWDTVDWLGHAQYRDHLFVLVNMVMKLHTS